MQSFAGAETTRRFSSILNSPWPVIAPPAIADAGCDSVSATRFFFDLTQ